jgi:hypothetical protein
MRQKMPIVFPKDFFEKSASRHSVEHAVSRAIISKDFVFGKPNPLTLQKKGKFAFDDFTFFKKKSVDAG